MTTKAWKNRIVDHGEETPDAILANPRNWRAHPDQQKDAKHGARVLFWHVLGPSPTPHRPL